MPEDCDLDTHTVTTSSHSLCSLHLLSKLFIECLLLILEVLGKNQGSVTNMSIQVSVGVVPEGRLSSFPYPSSS